MPAPQDNKLAALLITAMVVALIAGFVGGLSTGLHLAPDQPTREVTARTFKVVRVIDGDTFVIEYDGEPTSVRIHGIDAPERGEPGADAAAAVLRELVAGQTVLLEFPADSKRDNFGRLLARVTVDGQDVGAALLERGVAEPYRGL